MLPVLESIDQIDGFTEIAASDGHDHVDGVEVLLATEAPGQVGLGIGGGVELGAHGTEKAEVALRDLAGETEKIGDDSGNRDFVAKHPEFLLGIAVCHKVLLWKLEFGHGVGHKGFVDKLEVSGRRIEEAGRGDIVDLPWDTACIVMDEGFGFHFKDLFIATRGFHPGVDVGGSLVFSEGEKVASDGYSVDKIGQGGTGKEPGEGLLTAEDDLYGKLRIHG